MSIERYIYHMGHMTQFIIASLLRQTMLRCRSDVIITLLLRHLSAGYVHNWRGWKNRDLSRILYFQPNIAITKSYTYNNIYSIQISLQK